MGSWYASSLTPPAGAAHYAAVLSSGAPYPVIAVKRVRSDTDLAGQVPNDRRDEHRLFVGETTVLALECKLRCQAELAGVREGGHESQVVRQQRPELAKLVCRPQPPHESGKNLGHQAASGVIVVPDRPSRTAART
jgi:hypothetical protein